MKAQSATEFLIVVSLSIGLLIPIILIVNQYLIGYRGDTNLSLARDTVNKLGESADWVFSQGSPARLTLEIYIPDGVQQASLNNKMILLKVRTSSGTSDVYYNTIADLVGSIPSRSGHYPVSIIANTSYVNITVV